MFASNSSQVSSDAVFIEDVFSTYLYTGNSTSGGTQTITNNIDLSTKSGMVWIKGRSAASDHILSDTARGAGASATNNNALASNLTSAEDLGGSSYDFLSAFNADGFTVKQGGTTTATRGANYNNVTYTSWTFRKQPKFFDVVTYTGNGTNRTISHSLGSVPGCIIVKRTDTTADWQAYHRSLANTEYLVLNTTAAKATGATRWNSTTPTSTVFSLGTDTTVNANGGTYVAYLFAHDAGGFGTAGTDNVISCGSVTLSSGFTDVNLGYEPQFVLIKKTSAVQNWFMYDNMRGMPWDGYAELRPNLSNAEGTSTTTTPVRLTATGMQINTAYFATGDYIYIAIRRGPMKTPTSGTSVFSPNTYTGNGGTQNINGGFPLDMVMVRDRTGSSSFAQYNSGVFDRLRGNPNELTTSTTTAEDTTFGNAYLRFDNNFGYVIGDPTYTNSNGTSYVGHIFRRAPSFMDVVCFTGTGAAQNITHNLYVVPEMVIVKNRTTGTRSWMVYHSAYGPTKFTTVNQTSAATTNSGPWNDTAPTSTVFTVGSNASANGSGDSLIAYLFASCPGVSKVGSYSGTGAAQTIDCGFTSGARFVLIKRTDSTGDWYVWDTARGIVSGNDPYLLLNSTAAETTSTDYIDAYSAGFEISSTAPAAINASGGTFVFFAIS